MRFMPYVQREQDYYYQETPCRTILHCY